MQSPTLVIAACPVRIDEHAVKRMCAWCGRVQDGRGLWRLQDLQPQLARTTHGLCSLCADSIERQLDALEQRLQDRRPRDRAPYLPRSGPS